MKLRKLHIDNYKMFKDFDISFVGENDEALPIVVLAGVNGSGKTTLLECLYNPSSNFKIEVEDEKKSIKIANNNSPSFGYSRKGNMVEDRAFVEEDFYYKDIIYFPMNVSIQNIKNFLPKQIEKMVYQDEMPPKEVYKKIRRYLNFILEELNPQIEFDSRDGEGNLFFRNKSGGEKFSIDELSTGEKTLMSKILILYILNIQSKVILMDEPELSLHPSWQNRVLKIYEDFAEQNSCQIIIATHSPHIIGSAKPEYIRVLKKVEDKIVAIDNIDRSYGLEFDKVLTDIMGVENLRTPEVAKDIKRLWELLEDENYESEEYIELYDKLEDLLGELDKDMVLSRLEIARIKSRNAKSK